MNARPARRVAAAALVVYGLPALAAMPGDEPPPAPGIVEVSHDVTVKLEGGVARYTVTRRFENQGQLPDETIVLATLPEGGSATGMRRGARACAAGRRRGRAAPGSGPAPRRRRRGRRGSRRRRRWLSPGSLSLALFPVFPGETAVVEYTVTAPTVYGAGATWLSYPRAEAGEPAPRLHLDALGEGARLVDKPPGEAGPGIAVRVPPPPIDVVAVRHGAFALPSGRAIWRLELDAAPVLEPAPRDARVVFVIDASHTEGPEGVAAQLALVRGTLANLPDAQAEIVLYRRGAERLFGRFVPAARVEELLDATPAGRLAPGNGSDLDAGLALAAEALAGETRPARIVAMNDQLVRGGLTPDLAIAALRPAPAGTVVHLVVRGPDGNTELSERRIADELLSPIADAFGGVVLEVLGMTSDRAALAAVTLGLVRPIRIDDFQLAAAGVPADRLDWRDVLSEGTGARHFLIADAAPARVTLSGRIWGRAWRRDVPVDPAFTAALPALLFGDDRYAELADPDQLAAARAGGVVSPLTSYLAVEDGAAPSTAGWDTISGIGIGGSSCCSRCGGASCRGVGGYRVRADLAALLATWLRPGLAACAKRHDVGQVEVRVAVETTRDEIVAVGVAFAPGFTAPAGLARCVEDAAWAVRLDAMFREPHDLLDVEVAWADDPTTPAP